ncbi:Uncharacterised protein [Candidatus Tiddalikarchaeum anstoanum]|nr:Uncharacterised protein [Candidatus Tiddalikarchaeum anstoanum]
MVETVAGQALDVINRIGIFDVVVPFIIGAAALYGMLEKSQIFGKDRHDVNSMVAIGVGIIVTLSWSLRNFLLNFIPIIIVAAFFIFVGLLLLEWVGVKPDFVVNILQQPAVFIPVLLLLFVLVMVGLNGGLDFIVGRTNFTGTIGPASNEITPEDLANPAIVLAQPQVAGAILILAIMAAITYMITQKK